MMMKTVCLRTFLILNRSVMQALESTSAEAFAESASWGISMKVANLRPLILPTL